MNSDTKNSVAVNRNVSTLSPELDIQQLDSGFRTWPESESNAQHGNAIDKSKYAVPITDHYAAL